MQEDYFAKNPSNLIERDSVDELFHLMDKLAEMYLFRGVSNYSYKLEASLERTNKRFPHTEEWFINQFQRSIHEYLPVEEHPNNQFELLSLMQHHGVPTRLIDITRSPFIALYFACSGGGKPCDDTLDGAIYAFMHQTLQSASIKKIMSRSDLGFDVNWLNRYLKSDNKVFNEVFYKHRDDVAIIIEPYKVNKRQYAQQGLFLITNFWLTSSEKILGDLINIDLPDGFSESTLIKIRINGSFKSDILKRLDRMNINASTLFLGLGGFARYLAERHSFLDGYETNDMHGY